jgi:hypothetical protein
MLKPNWEKLQEFQNEHKDLLIMVASPADDSISISFGGLNTFVRFPGKDMEKGIVFNALRKSKFADSIDPLMCGIIESSGISDKEEGGEVLKVLGGSVKAIGEQRETLKANIKKDAKSTKNKNR